MSVWGERLDSRERARPTEQVGPNGGSVPMSNLPPGTTNADIDKHYGGTDVVVHADVTVGVMAETRANADDMKEEAILEAVENGEWEDVLNIEIVEEEPI